MIRGRIRPFAAFVRGLPGFLRDSYSVERARDVIRRGLDDREENFLSMVERSIFGYARSPYRVLFEHAQCELGDLKARVRSVGLDASLRELRESGVYVSFEEFKGRAPIERGDVAFPVQTEDFDNPYLHGGYRARTSGSTGISTPVWVSLRSLSDRIPHTMLSFHANNLLGAPSVMWREALPAPGIGMILEEVPMGQRYDQWFAPPLRRAIGPSVVSRIATETIVRAGRVAGVSLPRPKRLDYEDAIVVARWAAEHVRPTGAAVVRTGLSNALRACLAAFESGIDLAGTAFVGAGEPVTASKVEAIEHVGARWVSMYTVSEVGRVGVACSSGIDASDVHYATHVAAILPYPRRVEGLNTSVDTFHFTSLLPGSPKILLNVEADDYGVIEERRCGCPLEAAGLTKHLRDIYSVRKLTSEGVTFAGSDMTRILEEVLPRRFGGSSVDYQLAEEEDARGFTKLILVVSPRVTGADESQLIETVLSELGETGLGRDVRSIWSRAGAMRVVRKEPTVTQGGKVRPLAPKPDR